MRASCWARRFPLSAPVYYLLPNTRVSISALRVPLCALPDIGCAVRSLRKFSHRFPLPLDASPTSRCLCSPFSAAISTLRSTICLRLSAARCCLFLCVFFTCRFVSRCPLYFLLCVPFVRSPLHAIRWAVCCLLSAAISPPHSPPLARQLRGARKVALHGMQRMCGGVLRFSDAFQVAPRRGSSAGHSATRNS